MKGRRLLITGAAGFTGRHAVAYFKAAGAEVTAVVRKPSPVSAVQDGAQPYVCDLSDRKAVQAMVDEVRPDEVLHLAGRNSVPESWRDPLVYMETNVMATLYLLEGLRSRPGCRILVAGSRLKYRPGEDAGPPHPYSLSKTLEELVSLAWGTLFKQPVLLAEPCNLIGPGPSTGFCSLLAEHIVRSEAAGGAEGLPQPFKLSSRHTLRDFLDVRDAVRAYDYILKYGETGKVYKIDSGTERELGEIAGRLLALAKTPVPMDWGPEPGDHAAPPPVQSAAGKPEPPEASADNVSRLGWRAETGIEQSLADILDYYRNGKEGR
ncbi:nucleoside-diphosphate sugar epimerase [Paenibacillus sp. PK3_47]|uniref:NAD-dependent epimerase/dehydratase family protein n=1 Tax=Paenibacillus sp. PK3_47 TaxID=2072642 RepID=UPI00201DCADF|nr:NAD(P)-dependent oxidoreductase [Paenibacillus sp. PK3_47]UQZ33223.1 nucleoside-diphosphate sugar epimerase [Paenibacillus sp. PK3_47]